MDAPAFNDIDVVNRLCQFLRLNTKSAKNYPCCQCAENPLVYIYNEMVLWYRQQPTHQFCTFQNNITTDYHGLLYINRESKKWILQFKSGDYLAEMIEQCSRVDSRQSNNIKEMVMQVLLNR